MSTFSDHYDGTVRELESKLSDLIDSGSAFDFERNGDVVTIEFEDGAKFIITPNSPVEQLWVSANYAGSRFNWSSESSEWINDKDGEPLTRFLSEAVSAKLGMPVTV